MREAEKCKCQDYVEKIIESKEGHQLVEISLEFLSVEDHDGDAVTEQSKRSNYRLKPKRYLIESRVVTSLPDLFKYYQKNSFHNETEDLGHF